MFESMVLMLIKIIQMQNPIIICDLNITNLEIKQHIFMGAITTRVSKDLMNIEENVLMESNVVICAKTMQQSRLYAMANGIYALNYPWVILHNQDDNYQLSPSGINQQMYFYDMDAKSLYEKYTVNSVVVTRKLNINVPLGNIYERRANLHGMNMNVAVNALEPLHGIVKKQDIVTHPSGNKYFRVDKDNAYGILEDLLQVMERELNFTVR